MKKKRKSRMPNLEELLNQLKETWVQTTRHRTLQYLFFRINHEYAHIIKQTELACCTCTTGAGQYNSGAHHRKITHSAECMLRFNTHLEFSRMLLPWRRKIELI